MRFSLIIFLFILVNLSSGAVFSQDLVTIEQLKESLEKDGLSDSSFALIYQELAWEYRKIIPDSTIYYSELAIDIIEDNELTLGTAQAYGYIGLAYTYKGNNIKAYDFFNKSLEQAQVDDQVIQQAHAFNNLGRLFLDQGDYLRSYNSYIKAEELFKASNDQDGLSYALKGLSELYQTQKDYNKALQQAQKAYDLRVATNNIQGQISALAEIAEIYQLMGSYDLAFDQYKSAKEKAETIDDDISIVSIDLGISKLYFFQQKVDESLTYALKAYNEVIKTRNLDLKDEIELQLGKAYYALDELNLASGYLTEVIEEANDKRELEVLKEANYYLYEIATKNNEIEKRLDFYLEYTRLERILDNTEAARRIAQLESRYEIDGKTKENAVLKAQKALDEAEIARQRIQTYGLVGLTVILLAIAIIVSVFSRNRRIANLKLKEQYEEILSQREEISRQNKFINEQNEKLYKRNEQLDQLNQEKDTLMNIVAHDLKSPLNKVKGVTELLKLSGLNDEQKDYNNLLKDISQNGIDLIRDLLDVNAFQDDKKVVKKNKVDLDNFLLNKAKDFYSDAKSKDIQIVTELNDDQKVVETDDLYLARILDNLISNAIKFSEKGSKVFIGAVRDNQKIKLFVKDQGPGFSEEDKSHIYKKFTTLSAKPTGGEASNGLGLAIVKTLAERLEAEIDLVTEKGKGSEFILTFSNYVQSENKG